MVVTRGGRSGSLLDAPAGKKIAHIPRDKLARGMSGDEVVKQTTGGSSQRSIVAGEILVHLTSYFQLQSGSELSPVCVNCC